MKISIVTVVFNCVEFIRPCIESVESQDYPDIEHIVIDGGSTDGTVSEIKSLISGIHYFESCRDLGMYDALNKGISVATGRYIGILNADDCLAATNVISAIAALFAKADCDAVYGHLKITKRRDVHSIIRHWNSRQYHLSDFQFGWMPPHPTLYVKRSTLQKSGAYSLKFGSCADYDMILRLFYTGRINAVFLDKVIVLMRQGGMSNGSVKKVVTGIINDYKVLAYNDVSVPVFTLVLKKIRKLHQFHFKGYLAQRS